MYVDDEGYNDLYEPEPVLAIENHADIPHEQLMGGDHVGAGDDDDSTYTPLDADNNRDLSDDEEQNLIAQEDQAAIEIQPQPIQAGGMMLQPRCSPNYRQVTEGLRSGTEIMQVIRWTQMYLINTSSRKE